MQELRVASDGDAEHNLPSGYQAAILRLRPWTSDSKASEAMAIVTNAQIRDYREFELPSSNHKRRAIQVVQLSLEDALLNVVNVDLEIGVYHPGPDGRLQQIIELQRLLHDEIPAGEPVVLAGDFNTAGPWQYYPFGFGSRAEIRRNDAKLEGLGFRRAGPEDPVTTYRWLLYSKSLDHLYHRDFPPADFRVLRHVGGSDHYPVEAVYTRHWR